MIYFLKDLATGYVKVGYSSNIRRRLASLQTSSPSGAALIAWMEGDATVERSLHERFASARVHREWFRPSGDLTSFIEHEARTGLPPAPAAEEKVPEAVPSAHRPLHGKELQEWRLSVGLSRKEAGAHLGYSWRTIENWENGRRPIAHPRVLRTMMDLMSKRLGL